MIIHRHCGAVGVFHLRFVHYIGVGCKVVRMHHMGLPFHGSPLVPPPLSPVPSKHERNLPTSLKRGEGHLGRVRVRRNGPHPSGEGRGRWWDVRYQPTSLGRGEGQEAGVGVLRWLWWLMNPRSTVIDIDLAFKLRSNLKDLQNPDIKARNQNDVAICQLYHLGTSSIVVHCKPTRLGLRNYVIGFMSHVFSKIKP